MRRCALLLIALAGLAAPAAAESKVLHGPATLTCDGRVTFSQYAFANPPGAELGTDDAAQALRDHIASRSSELPASGWRVLARTDDVVVFHAGRPASGIAVTFLRVDGAWRPAGFGCSAHRVVRGYVVPFLRPAPERPLRRGARSLVLQIEDGSCPPSRFRFFEVLETRYTVTVVALMRPGPPLPPDTACAAVVRVVTKRVRLSRPLGRRVVRDASSFPARPIGRASE